MRAFLLVFLLVSLAATAGCVSQRGGDSGIDQVADIYGTTPPPDSEGIQKQVAGIRGEIDPGHEGGNETFISEDVP